MRHLPFLLVLAACAPAEPSLRVQGSSPQPPTAEAPPEEKRVEHFTYEDPRLDMIFIGQYATAELLADIEVFVASLESRHIDYHLGVVNMDDVPEIGGHLEMVDGQRWAHRAMADPADWLRRALLRFVDRSGNEAAMLAAAKALENCEVGGANFGFLRDDSEVAFLTLHAYGDVSPYLGLDVEEFVQVLLEVRTDTQLLGWHNIGYTPPAGDHPYQPIYDLIGGLAWDHTNTPYAPLYLAIAGTVEVDRSFHLAGRPVPETLWVHVLQPDGSEVDLHGDIITYDPTANSIEVDFPLVDGAAVQVTYEPLDA